MKEAHLLYGATDFCASHFSADIFWATGGFRVPDPVYLFVVDGKKVLATSSLEIERAHKEARVDEVILLSAFRDASAEKPIIQFLRERGVTDVILQGAAPYSLGDLLSGFFTVRIEESPFLGQRSRKTEAELSCIENSQRAVEHAVRKGIDVLAESTIKGDLLYHANWGDTPLTAEMVRSVIDGEMYARGYLGIGSIISCGVLAADPHCQGSGVLKPFQSIVLDIFPRSIETLYYADQTRTVFKGKPDERYLHMYRAVLAAQEKALSLLRPGIDGSSVYRVAYDMLESAGYPTNLEKRPVYGFIHGLGHGVGIEIHEHPSLGTRSCILEEGMVVTVEPGLYYPQSQGDIPACGIRIEDMAVITKDGFKNLTRFSKKVDDMIV